MLRLLMFIFLFLGINELRSQVLPDKKLSIGLKAVYKAESRPDSMDLDNFHTNFDVLLISSEYNTSMYAALKYITMDSIKRVERMKGNPYGPDMSWYMANGTKNSTVIYKDHERQVITAHERMASTEPKHFIYEETDSMNWKLIDQHQMINNVKCYKAELNFGGRKWIAWYNPEIPISDGPYKFHGLPGLIFRIEDGTSSWKFNLVELSEENTSILFNCSDTDHENTSKLEFEKAKR